MLRCVVHDWDREARVVIDGRELTQAEFGRMLTTASPLRSTTAAIRAISAWRSATFWDIHFTSSALSVPAKSYIAASSLFVVVRARCSVSTSNRLFHQRQVTATTASPAARESKTLRGERPQWTAFEKTRMRMGGSRMASP